MYAEETRPFQTWRRVNSDAQGLPETSPHSARLAAGMRSTGLHLPGGSFLTASTALPRCGPLPAVLGTLAPCPPAHQ